MKYLVWVSIIISLLVVGCTEDATPTPQPVGQSAAQATEGSLATSIAKQVQATPQPEATAVVLGNAFPTATLTP